MAHDGAVNALLQAFLFGLLLCGLSACQAPELDQEAQPNILLILIDDAGYVDFGFQGSVDLQTPHLDRLAEESVIFEQAYVSASVCSPSRAGLLTGRYQQRFGHEFNLKGNHGLPLQEKTLAEALMQQGYRTAVVGKWHLGSSPEYHPMQRGFQHFTGLLGGSRSYFPMSVENTGPQRLQRDGQFLDEEEEFTYLTDFLAAEAARIIQKPDPRPWFLYLAYTAPHTPMHPREDWYQHFQSIEVEGRRKYAAMQASLDQSIGAVLEAVKASGEADQTLVVFLNDNGGATTNHSDNGPWRGMKGSKWEGGIRVPCMMRWPNRFQGGQKIEAPISALDLFPTALAAARADPQSWQPELDGINLLPFLRDQGAKARKWEFPKRPLFWRRGPAAAVRLGDWKLIRVDDQESPLLFNLAEDPGETINLASQHQDHTENLLAALQNWEQELVEPLWDTGQYWRDNQRKKHRMDVIGREAERKLP
ncbi:MAG: N-acetylgalactosamine 6-sulfate sulfatase [Planctomycetota bacterium]|nr:MAG: N-acetylgalactosamine 6-sulfate sulfatase [Planctomycetota bacterium]